MTDKRRSVKAGFGRRKALGLLAAGIAFGSVTIRQARAQDAELAVLIRAAKAEGTLTFYIGLTENVALRVSKAFTEIYGIKAQYLRADGVPLEQRYATEAEAGNIIGDAVIVAGGADEFSEMGEKKGWIQPLSAANLPILNSGTFPEKFFKRRSAIVQISPWLVAYNTEKVQSADVPKDYADLCDAKWKGQVLVNDPGESAAFIDFWALLLDTYGPDLIEKLRLNIRQIATPNQSTQALGAGEASFGLPQVTAQVDAVKDKGAPLSAVAMDVTTGVQSQLIMTTPSKAKHPNAAKLFCNWCLSPEGNKVINNDPGNFSVYDVGALPKRYTPPKPGTFARKDEIRKLLGFA